MPVQLILLFWLPHKVLTMHSKVWEHVPDTQMRITAVVDTPLVENANSAARSRIRQGVGVGGEGGLEHGVKGFLGFWVTGVWGGHSFGLEHGE